MTTPTIDAVETLTNNTGGRVPVSRIRPEVVLAHQTAVGLVERARRLQSHIEAEKAAIWNDIEAYLQLVLEHYGARLGGRRGGLTMASFNDCMKVEVSTADYSRVTGAIVAAQSLMNEILDDVTEGAATDLRALVENAFKRDETTGRVNVQRLSGLRRLNLSHPKWELARAAIGDAIEPAGSRRYVRFYIREGFDAPWAQIDLNFSSL